MKKPKKTKKTSNNLHTTVSTLPELTPTDTPVLVFPCDFPIKVIGIFTEHFLEEITVIVRAHFPKIANEQITHKLSKEKNYLAITVNVHATNKSELDELYQALTSHPNIKMVL